MECPMRSWIRRLERDARGHLESFELIDGAVYHYDPLETLEELFMHAYDVQLGDADKWPEPPLVYRMICEARDPAAVLERFRPENPQGAFVDPAALFDTNALVTERRLVPISYEPPEDLSEH